jgi:hypothetical protein
MADIIELQFWLILLTFCVFIIISLPKLNDPLFAKIYKQRYFFIMSWKDWVFVLTFLLLLPFIMGSVFYFLYILGYFLPSRFVALVFILLWITLEASIYFKRHMRKSV